MSESQPVFILDDHLEENYVTHIVPAFKSLRAAHMTIAPWIEPNFWDNVKSEKFSDLFSKELFDQLLKLTATAAKSKKEISPKLQTQIESCLISLLHLLISYRRFFPDNIWKDPYEKLIAAGIPTVSSTMVHLSNILNSPDINMKTILDNITKKHDNVLLLSTVPLFNFLGLIRLMRQSPLSCRTIFQAFKTRLESLNVLSEAASLLHILKVIISIFPGLRKDLLDSLLQPLQASLIYPVPVSSMGADLGFLIKKALDYPGSAFYDVLRTIGESNIATNGTIPFIFDQTVKFLPNLLHTRQVVEFGLETTLYNFGNFYLHEKFHHRPRKPKHVVKLLQMLDFTEKATEKIIKKFKIQDDDPKDPNEPVTKEDMYDVSTLKPPLMRISQIKLSVNFQPNPMITTDFVEGSKMFMTPTTAIFKSQVIDPIAKWAKEQEDKDLFQYNIAICGGDFFLGSVISSFVKSLADCKDDLANLVHTFYLIPLDHSQTSELARYISCVDDIYSRFVNDVYHIVSTMAPLLDELSLASFPSVVISEPSESNIWFANPSPSVILQLAIQHYLLFAKYSCNCYVWQAILEFDNSLITVPFITSLHIGTQFANGKFVDPDEKKIKSRKFAIEIAIDSNEQRSKSSIQDFTSLVFWNVNADERVRPNDKILLLETANETSKTEIKLSRDKLGDKATRSPVTSAYIKSAEKTPVPFKVFIDQRIYGPVKSVRIQPMKPILGYEHQLRVRIATFVPFE